ncbi:PP2C family protein-serine/threonine phosphatase [Amycolatopsis sp., V23-08]|uniref:PP2C family protein-serine/threonine phosphatase n=1 Tax=Amycolatopsis heterodermiae TaxID=3110235 RepID=A0ABU5R5W8_9PSEU|nr:PP2C family protein-serine/threonine phosphatase [Amycolatopsis sp., V23-08]MEA5361563.1 PP2C family protein-serine/threonine phosphatase [Amycolatopsis sp., V23-08]
MAERVETAPATPLTGDRGWDAAPAAAIVADGAGVIRALNEAARLLFPDAAPGRPLAGAVADWLAEADERRTSEITRGEVGERFIAAHPVPHGDAVTWWLVDETDIRAAQDALAHEQERTAFLSEASAALLGSLNLERCMEVAARLAAEHLADAALVLAPATGGLYPAVTCVRGGEPTRGRLEIDPDELPGLGEALQGFPPVPSRWLDPDSAPRWVLPGEFGPVGSIVVTPLPGHGVPAGALVLLRGGDRRTFSEQEELFARLFAARAGAAMSAARVFALQASITDTLMRELLPPTLEQLGGVEFAGRYRPALDGERIGGDFYDVHSAVDGDGGESLAVLGDVCGKGLDAAVLTGKIRTTLRALLPTADDHHRLLGLLNRTIAGGHDTRYVTLVLASARREGATVRLRVTCAGHPPPLVVRADGRVEEADTRGSLIGVLPEIESVSADVTLNPGETCLMFTDGIIEAKGGPLGDTMFGEDRLRRILSECANMPADAVVERVQMVASQWIGRGDHDDMAVLAITAPRGQHLAAVGGHGRGRYTA